jgi:diguanylate cyclase (GGDEF)-like protein
MRSLRRNAVFFALLLTCAAAGAQGPRISEQPLRIITTAREAHSLPSSEAARGYPVHLRATVTYYDPFIDSRHGALFVHDATGSIFVEVPARPILPLQAGSEVDVVGVSGPGDYAPVVDHAQMHVVGQSHVPEVAPAATMTQLLSGSLDGQWVEVEGVVRSVYLTDGNAVIEIATTEGSLSATTPRQPRTDYDAFVDSLVRVRGNAGPEFNQRRQMVGVHLFFPSLGEVKVMQAAPPDPFAMPVRPIASLLHFTPGLQLAHRVHMQGRVTLQWPGRMLCIQQASDGLCMQTFQTNPVSVGQLVDVIGFPAIREYKPTLENAIFHHAGGSSSTLSAKSVTAEEALHAGEDGGLVQIVGELIGQDRAAGDLTLMLRSGKLIFPAVFPESSKLPDSLPWKNGSLVRLTGICNVQVNPETTNHGEGAVRPELIRILLRSTADVEVLRAPSWWTAGHALAVLAVVGFVALAAFFWILVLRLRVDQQTRALRASEERLRHMAQHDALTGLPNRLLLSDRLDLSLSRAKRFEQALGLLMVDVDEFKQVNDSYGHHVGDFVLCEIATRIRAAVRETDTVARLGGDEFVVLLPDLHQPEEAELIAAKIVAAISAPILIGSAHISITVSLGVCTYPEGGKDSQKLLQSVDAAMYNVKAQGRNGFQVYRPGKLSTLHN